MKFLIILAIIMLIGFEGTWTSSCLSERMVGSVIDSILRKRKGLTLRITPDDLERLVNLKNGCAGNEIRKKLIYFSVCLDKIMAYPKVNDVVRFNTILTNEGSAYNPSTATFSPPRDGAFFLSFGYKTDIAKFTELHLTVNGVNVIRGTVPGDTRHETAERTIVLNLKKNDKVQITVPKKGTKLYGYANLVCFSAFSID